MKTAFNLDDYSKKHGTDYSGVWDSLSSQILLVTDEEGNNVGAAQVRHLIGKSWLYVDDQDGYSILDESEVSRLCLIEE